MGCSKIKMVAEQIKLNMTKSRLQCLRYPSVHYTVHTQRTYPFLLTKRIAVSGNEIEYEHADSPHCSRIFVKGLVVRIYLIVRGKVAKLNKQND